MKFLRVTVISMAIVLFHAASTLAVSTRVMYQDEADGTRGSAYGLDVHAGYGLTINFRTGELIQRAWLGDASGFTLSFDSPLCSPDVSTRQQPCDSRSGARVIFINSISTIDFSHQRHSNDGATLLTVITNTQKQYQFVIVPQGGDRPSYTTITVLPVSQRPDRLLGRPARPVNPSTPSP
jgi:hypothetical protein